jgi:formate/nitrite transporter
MGWADGRVTLREVLRNWIVVCAANFAGAAGLALIVYLSGHWQVNGGAVGATYLKIAAAKAALPFGHAFFLAVLCNILVCLAVWMALAGRSVVDKFFAIVLPISAFVAAGFEHSVANMYYFPLALLLKWHGLALPPGGDAITVAGMVGNLIPVIAGNIVGGSVLVALVYWAIYLRGRPPGSDAPRS